MADSQFLTKEDDALKTLLKGQTVSDSGASLRPVGVIFGLPDKEVIDSGAIFPFISIDLVNISPALDRARSGPYLHTAGYVSEEWVTPRPGDSLMATLPPTPFNLDYQITTWCRNPRHDRQLLTSLLRGPLPYQFGHVSVLVDQTERRLDVTGILKRSTLDSSAKRILRNVFSVRMSAELAYWEIQSVQQALSVNFLDPITPTAYTPLSTFSVTATTPPSP